MPKPDVPLPNAPLGLAAWVRKWLVGLLVASYALATFAPAPGVWLNELGDRSEPLGVRFSLVMVGVLLFCGAMAVDLGKLWELPQRPVALALALLGVWVPPLLVAAAWSYGAPGWLSADDAAAISVGLALAAAMPVANSAVAWTHQSGGSLVWALGLVVLSICLCPWVTPGLLGLTGIALSGPSALAADQVVGRFSGVVFVVWVLGPTLLGLAVRSAVGGSRAAAWAPWLTLTSAAALLLLNYANASAALPQVFGDAHWPVLATTLAAAVSLPLAGTLAAWPLAMLAGVSRPGRLAWSYALGMKNTGLALGLAGATLGDRPVAVLVILAVTLLQHAVAGVVHAIAARRAPRDDSAG